MRQARYVKHSQGFTLIEVLVTFLIMAIGLLGLASLQLSTLNSQFEAYQRTQANLLIEDMGSRIRANSIAARADNYTVNDQYGLLPEPPSPGCSALAGAARDLCLWDSALKGVDVDLSGQKVGSMVNARGCIANIAGTIDNEKIIRVTVAWQGNSPTAAPSSSCGQGNYGANDSYRRVASLDVVLANLAL
jgi:type IV pilus assembly protein PilV